MSVKSGRDQPLNELADMALEGDRSVAGHALLVLPGIRDGDDGGASPLLRNLHLEPGSIDDSQQDATGHWAEVARVFVRDAIRTGGLPRGQATQVVLQLLHGELRAAGAALS